jgi:Flp pilus assembly pilin Flp
MLRVSRRNRGWRFSHADHEKHHDAAELTMRQFQTDLRNDERGTTAVEFAIVGPIFIFLVIGIAFLCMGMPSLAACTMPLKKARAALPCAKWSVLTKIRPLLI